MGDNSGSSEECSVCVAVKLRPLVPSELEQGCRLCLSVTPGTPQVCTGAHNFTYDYVFGDDATEPDQLYSKCVSPLVEGLFRGYNATVFAYGQTGSGKSFTMGSEYKPGGKAHGVIPEAIGAIFQRIESIKDYECCVRVSFVEIHKEEIKDLLASGTASHNAVSIREGTEGGVSLYGATEKEVRSVDEMAGVLEMGTLCRATASTSMNSKSSRSHAIYTITVEQRRQAELVTQAPDDDDEGVDNEDAAALAEEQIDDYLCAKMHLVDLAGSERAKRTKAEGARLKEGIHINQGLLALGNVINAIVDRHKHIPYRNSKLTRLLQDSLGGNSRTVMIACVSPADINLEESLNTLRYADRARQIKNKPVVNRDPVAAQVAALRQQVARLQSENTALKRAATSQGKDPMDGGEDARWQMVEQLQQDTNTLELENARLKVQLDNMRSELGDMTNKFYSAKAELDLMQIQHGAPAAHHAGRMEVDGGADTGRVSESGHSGELLRSYLSRITDLEKEVRSLRSLQQLNTFRRRTSHNEHPHPVAAATPGSPQAYSPSDGMQGATTPLPAVAEGENRHMAEIDGADGEASPDVNVDEQCFYAEMAAHALEQEKMKQDMAVLQRVLEQKERKMQELMKNTVQVPALKQHYDRVLQELEKERDTLQGEKVQMMQKLHVLHSASEEERKRMEVYYKEKIAQYDERLREVRRKEREFITMQKLKMRTEELCGRLNADITRIKSQKVALQKTMEASAKQFAQWRAEREKELLQLRRQNRRAVVQIQHLEALQAKQNAVLQRKISDATAARKKLKELQAGNSSKNEARNGSAASVSASQSGSLHVDVLPNSQAPLLRNERSRRDWLEKELDMCNQSYEYQRVLDGELAQRAETMRHLREVEKRLMLSENLVPASPLVVDGMVAVMPVIAGEESKERLKQRRLGLQLQLEEHNTQITELQAAWEQAKLEEEGRGGGAADAKRWTGVRNAVEARELLRTLFRVACDHKSQAKEIQMDLTKIQEEGDLMRVQLDAARKEAEAQRKRAAAIEATAATAMATPFAAESAAHDDDMDAEVDDLLMQLQVVAATPGSGLASGHCLVAKGSQDVGSRGAIRDSQADASRLHEKEGLDGTVQVHVQASKAVAKALSFPSPSKGLVQASDQAAGSAAAGTPPAPSDAAQPSSQGTAAAAAGVPNSIGISPDGRVVSTLPISQGKRSGRYAASLGMSLDVAHAEDGGSIIIIESDMDDSDMEMEDAYEQNDAATKGTDMILEDDGEEEDEAEGDTEEEGETQQAEEAEEEEEEEEDEEKDEDWDLTKATPAKPKRMQGRRSTSREPQDQPTAAKSSSQQPANASAVERQVLQHVNQQRQGQGLSSVERVTVKMLKDQLTGKVVDGRAWRAGNKHKEQLLQDYCTVFGVSTSNPVSTAAEEASVAAAAPSPSPSGRQSPSRYVPSPMAITPGPDVSMVSRLRQVGHGDYREALMSPRNGAAGGYGLQGFSPRIDQPASRQLLRAATLSNSPMGSRLPTVQLRSLGSPRSLQSSGLAGHVNTSNSPMSDWSVGDGPAREHNLTPLSMLYIQKAQEARERTAQLRQSIQKGAAGFEAAAAARASSQNAVPRMSFAAANPASGAAANTSCRSNNGSLSARSNGGGNLSARAWSPPPSEDKPSPRPGPSPRQSPTMRNPNQSNVSPRIWR